MFRKSLPFILFLACTVAIGGTAFAGSGRGDDSGRGGDDGGRPTLLPREVFYYPQEEIEPELNYMRDVMDSAGMVQHIRATIENKLRRRGYQAYNYRLLANKRKYRSNFRYMTVETDVDINRKGMAEFDITVRMRAEFYEFKGGKRLKVIKGKAKERIFQNYNTGVRQVVEDAFKPMEDKLPAYREY